MEKELQKMRDLVFNYERKIQELENRLGENTQELENSKKMIQDLQDQNVVLQESKKELQVCYEQALNSKTISGYTDQLEKECNSLRIIVEKLREENISIVKDRETYEMTHSQIRLDNETVMIEVAKLKSENQVLKAENKALLEENKNLVVANNVTPPVTVPKSNLQVGSAPTSVSGLKKNKLPQPVLKQQKR
jgi:hypothetical protein